MLINNNEYPDYVCDMVADALACCTTIELKCEQQATIETISSTVCMPTQTLTLVISGYMAKGKECK